MALLATSSAVALSSLAYRVVRSLNEPTFVRRSVPSPRETLVPHLTVEQAGALAYPPDLLPGARDVSTPHGTMRVYEWGPTDGKKVVFIHGDTSPAPILAPIAKALVSRGCRVIMFGMVLLDCNPFCEDAGCDLSTTLAVRYG